MNRIKKKKFKNKSGLLFFHSGLFLNNILFHFFVGIYIGNRIFRGIQAAVLEAFTT